MSKDRPPVPRRRGLRGAQAERHGGAAAVVEPGRDGGAAGRERGAAVDDAEMAEIRADQALVERLRTGSLQARERKGTFVE